MASGYVAFYLSFFAIIALLGFLGSDFASGEELSALPQLDESPGLFGTIGYGFEFIGYVIGLQGLVVLGLPIFISTLLALVLDGYMLYVIVRLVRGGG